MTRLAALAALWALGSPALAQTPRAADPPPAAREASTPQTAEPADRGGGQVDPAAKRLPERGEQEPPAADIGY